MTLQRFDCFPDPVGKWMVWDLNTQWVACLSSRELLDLSEEEARQMHAFLSGDAPPTLGVRIQRPHLRLVASN